MFTREVLLDAHVDVGVLPPGPTPPHFGGRSRSTALIGSDGRSRKAASAAVPMATIRFGTYDAKASA